MGISTSEEILAWAKDTVAGGGTKYTVLSKSEQFAIASYICEGANTVGGVSSSKEIEPKMVEPPSEGLIDTSAAWAQKSVGEADKPQDTDAKEESIPIKKGMSRRESLVARGIKSPQAAYEEFLRYAQKHPIEAKVMDFSNGKQSIAAAFAWWLTEGV